MKHDLSICLYTNPIFCLLDPQLFYLDKVSWLRLATYVVKQGLIIANFSLYRWSLPIFVSIIFMQCLQSFLDRRRLRVTKLLLFTSSLSPIPFLFACPLGLLNKHHTKKRILYVTFNFMFAIGVIINIALIHELRTTYWCQKRDVWSLPNLLKCPPPDDSAVGDFSLSEVYPMCADTENVDCTRKLDVNPYYLFVHNFSGMATVALLLVYTASCIHVTNRFTPIYLYK